MTITISNLAKKQLTIFWSTIPAWEAHDKLSQGGESPERGFKRTRLENESEANRLMAGCKRLLRDSSDGGRVPSMECGRSCNCQHRDSWLQSSTSISERPPVNFYDFSGDILPPSSVLKEDNADIQNTTLHDILVTVLPTLTSWKASNLEPSKCQLYRTSFREKKAREITGLYNYFYSRSI